MVPAGAAGPPLPPGWRVVTTAKSLGVHFGDWKAATPPMEYAAVVGVLGMDVCMPVSMFGRAAAASAYALGKVLYHLEFAGLPSETAVKALLGQVAAVVDRPSMPLTPAPGR